MALSNNALPTDGKVVGGSSSATITKVGSNELDINQSTNSAIINWSTFNIGSNASVVFNQPTTQSVTLNRVTNSQSPSQIFGNLKANGTVILVNSQGILFGPHAHVNVGGLIATSSDISDKAFNEGNYSFNKPGSSDALIENDGDITASDGGVVALVGPNVINNGLIKAKLGNVVLASGDSFSIDLAGDGLLSLQASDKIKKQLVQNSGDIEANGGEVLMTAAAAKNALNSVVNMDGLVEADTVGSSNGNVELLAEGAKGEIIVDGDIQARGTKQGETGGMVDVFANSIDLKSHASIDVSGSIGGGSVAVGGNASLNIEKGSRLIANATKSGKGGNINLYSAKTNYAGSAEATGGAQGGDGGNILTAGFEKLTVTGGANASAAKGNNGLWTISGADLVIDAISNSSSKGQCNGSAPTGKGSNISNVSVSNALNSGTDVFVTGVPAGKQTGSITVADNVTKTKGVDTTLTLQASSDVVVKKDVAITSDRNKLNVDLVASNKGGSVEMKKDSTLASNGGTVSLSGGAIVMDAHASIYGKGGSITLTGAGGSGPYGIYLGKGAIVDSETFVKKAPLFAEALISIGSTAVGGQITFIADTIGLAGPASIQTGGNVLFEPYSKKTTIGVAGGAGTLQLTKALLDDVTAGSITIGNTTRDKGNITMNAYSWRAPVSVLTKSGNIFINGQQASGAHTFLAETVSGNIIIGRKGGVSSSAPGTAITLAASGGKFINRRGSDALDVKGRGRWLVYSHNPKDDVFGNLDSANTAVWNTTYDGSALAQTGNRYVFAYQPTVTLTTDNLTKTYGVDYTAIVANDYVISGLSDGVKNAFLPDRAETIFSGTPVVTSAGAPASALVNGSPYAINIAQGSVEAHNGYAVTFASEGLLTVTAATPVVGPTPISNPFIRYIYERVPDSGSKKRPPSTLLSLAANAPVNSLPELAPAAGGNNPAALADLSPAAGGNGAGATALIQCNESTPCDINQ